MKMGKIKSTKLEKAPIKHFPSSPPERRFAQYLSADLLQLYLGTPHIVISLSINQAQFLPIDATHSEDAAFCPTCCQGEKHTR
jgi:hypothetical protein